MQNDPVATNPTLYRVVLENDRVRVLEYQDRPGDRTAPHAHPDSVMITLSAFRRRLVAGSAQRDVEMSAGVASWLNAQEHSGENIGETDTRVFFVELKSPSTEASGHVPTLGPTPG